MTSLYEIERQIDLEVKTLTSLPATQVELALATLLSSLLNWKTNLTMKKRCYNFASSAG